MRHGRVAVTSVVVLCLAGIIAVVPGCGKAPEQPSEPQPTTSVQQEAPPIEALELPLTNPEIGITVESVPEDLVATYNGEHWMVFGNRNRREVTYTLLSDLNRASGVRGSNLSEFRANVARYTDGGFTDTGEVDTQLGIASWASGVYSEDGETISALVVSVPHPSREGRLFITSNCPPEVASVEQRLATIEQLLGRVS